MGKIETIFDHSPTASELEELYVDYAGINKDEYARDLEKRAKDAKSAVEYEALIDLQELFNLRKDQDKVDQYGQAIEKKYSDIVNRIMNE